MSPSADSLARKLESDNPTERLEAARFLAINASNEHEAAIRKALATEHVRWIHGALRRALARVSTDYADEEKGAPLDREDIPARFVAQVHAEALETTAALLIHEIEPMLGSVRMAASQEIAAFDVSRTKKSLDRFDDLLEALSRLRKAASAPQIDEFSLDDLVDRMIAEVNPPADITILRAGAQPCVVEGDATLISLCVSNGLRNAVEATQAAGHTTDAPITVTWGTTDIDNWVAILDSGIGFKGNLKRAMDIGTTTKKGHLGMGLAIANQAMGSMSGQLLLVPNERGVRFEIRWPKKPE
jgi:signal transduction histidine kinase